jgi:mono/diheme cytochrome c family protein/glucose/arabinose dehydrogenase
VRVQSPTARWVAVTALLLALATGAAIATRGELARIYSGRGRPRPDAAPVLPPLQALAGLRPADPTLRVRLAAAEPLVEAPVAGQFDEYGRLWIVEMRGYMPDLKATGENAPTGRIAVLTDTDDDGEFDRRTTFLDGLILPRAVAPCYGGALVLEPPHVYFCRDTDGDGRSDEKRIVVSGIGIGENPEHAGNGLVRGLDNWYHLSQDRIELRFDGRTAVTRPTPAHGQWGLSHDDFGRLHYTPNSNPLLADAYPKHYASRNAAQGTAPGVVQDICPDTAAWPAHATPGVNRGYRPDMLRADGTLAAVTAVCGTHIHRDGGLGEPFRGSIFICEPAGNFVKRLVRAEGAPKAENAYKHTEFLRSTDERFRPVNALSGPDGALYILDMYRGLIQHRTYVTPYLAEQVRDRGLESPLILGRIYRIHDGSPRRSANPGDLSGAELVELLESPDGWMRDTAQRLLVERLSGSAADAVRTVAMDSRRPASRLHALWTLEGLRALAWDDVHRASRDTHPAIRAAAARLAETFHDQPGTARLLTTLLDDGSREVRLQAVASIGELPDTPRIAGLASVLKRWAGDRTIRGLAISGLAGREPAMIAELLKTPGWATTDASRPVLNDLADTSLRGSPASRSAYVDLVGTLLDRSDQRAEALLDRLRRAQKLDSDRPTPLAIAREPSALLAAAEGDVAKLARESADYLDWPGRPVVQRKLKPRDLTAAETARFEQGRILYAACIGCHQITGEGSVGMAPPLMGSAIVQGPPDTLARILLHGMEGPYTMLDMEFEGAMVPVPMQNDAELAAVMTYIRRAWGNSADPVDAGVIAATRSAHPERSTPWKREELLPRPQ